MGWLSAVNPSWKFIGVDLKLWPIINVALWCSRTLNPLKKHSYNGVLLGSQERASQNFNMIPESDHLFKKWGLTPKTPFSRFVRTGSPSAIFVFLILCLVLVKLPVNPIHLLCAHCLQRVHFIELTPTPFFLTAHGHCHFPKLSASPVQSLLYTIQYNTIQVTFVARAKLKNKSFSMVRWYVQWPTNHSQARKGKSSVKTWTVQLLLNDGSILESRSRPKDHLLRTPNSRTASRSQRRRSRWQTLSGQDGGARCDHAGHIVWWRPRVYVVHEQADLIMYSRMNW